MRKTRIAAVLGYILFLFSTLPIPSVSAQTKPAEAFTLKDGDRVVFLGNSIFENDFQYGYLELALTTRFADKGVTFRNLGWTGDNVWGEARSTYTNPPTPYEHLMEDITKTQPTVVFLGYGGVEAQGGQAGVPHFKEGLNKLLDKIEELGAKAVLLSTIPVVSSDTAQRIDQRNADLELYSKAISEVATQRKKQFIDIYNPILNTSKKESIIENTVHLNELGYYYLATTLEKALGLDAAKATTAIAIANNKAEVSNGRSLTPDKEGVLAKFAVDNNYLPLPSPKSASWIVDNARIVKISGLKKGYYTLVSENNEVASASAKDWEKGVEIKQGPQFAQVAEIRNMILKKNELHFFQYRPLNQTYIIGFRRYEQGRHVKGLEEQNILIKWLEGQIILNSEPKEVLYELRKMD
ncbi:GDSL-type esterase/lipase family protein [Dyadobacter fanqingshengii]|uniref:GDSL-type esterase/lipase family protein n=1 Tax=Dyadobacter fanqingshengii TaxID=2906443 RepID=A0A9X1TGT3_9BACT|nr:GDSL-type esterase/lipase family protein [Dyadobacter fanqingshengii]MCF0040792.1 GDSL-type esterase/lipase family protein [Dyadobacter fanqingshengii]USJ37473.1 GDSL-type esterase/lipase family protein [Dyadobacter fanqingshengii]